MAEFRVVIEGLELDESMTKQINDDIQKVVLSHLAEQDFTGGPNKLGVVAFRPHPDWLGLIAQMVKHDAVLKIRPVANTMKNLGIGQ